jgi:16S rRNA G527 N7-methylase RsmG
MTAKATARKTAMITTAKHRIDSDDVSSCDDDFDDIDSDDADFDDVDSRSLKSMNPIEIHF